MDNDGQVQTGATEDEREYHVEVSRTFVAQVSVRATSPQAAAQKVNARNFPLPELPEWQGMKDWRYSVFDAEGGELYTHGD